MAFPAANISRSPEQVPAELTPLLERPASTSGSLWLHSRAQNPPQRIGLLLDGPKLLRFTAEIIKHIQAANAGLKVRLDQQR